MRRPLALIVALTTIGLLSACSTTPQAGPTPTPAATSQSTSSDGTRLQVGVPFATVDGVTLRLDACLPVATKKASPGLVIVPGGGFTERTRDWLRPECQEGAARGYATFIVDYRLATEGSKGGTRFPIQIKDVERSIEFIRATAQEKRFGVDPDNMVLLGESAGAIIASEIAVGSPGATLPKDTFRGVALFSGLYDFGGDYLTDYLIGVSNDYLGCRPSASCAPTKTASSARYVDKDDPPMLLVNAKAELMPSEQMTELAAKLKAKGVPVQTVLAPSYHALDIARHYAFVRTALWGFVKARTSR